MLQNAYLLAKIGADTDENEQHFAENLPKIGNYPTGPRPGSSSSRRMVAAAAQPREERGSPLRLDGLLLQDGLAAYLGGE